MDEWTEPDSRKEIFLIFVKWLWKPFGVVIDLSSECEGEGIASESHLTAWL